MDMDQLVETFARMNDVERTEFAEKLSTKWPDLATQIRSLLEVYDMIHNIEHVYPGSDCQV